MNVMLIYRVPSLSCRVLFRADEAANVFFTHFFSFADIRVALHQWSCALVADPPLQQTLVIALADLLPSQILETRTKRAVDIVVLAHKTILSWIAKLVELVTPVAIKEEPSGGCLWRQVRASQIVTLVVVGKGI